MTGPATRVLIYRQGSLGDTIVALPSLHLIARRFPKAERRLLTNIPVGPHVVPAVDLLQGAGLIDGAIEYPLRTRDWREFMALRRRITAWRPDVLIYLVEERSMLQRVRDRIFFRLCGINRIVGADIGRFAIESVQGTRIAQEEMPEAKRLANAIAVLGAAHPGSVSSFDLRLTEDERAVARHVLSRLPPDAPRLAFSIGTKWQTNDYTDANWTRVFHHLSKSRPELAIIAIGAREEATRMSAILEQWPGPKLALCGTLRARESGAVLQASDIFLGHDSGPMHLAAAVGTPCVAVFSGRNPAGKWDPVGTGHRVLRVPVSCAPCGLAACYLEAKRCILSISPKDVADACLERLSSIEHAVPQAETAGRPKP